MDRVTQDKNALHWPMEDEKSTRFAQWKEGLVAGSHVLVKAMGSTITASWDVTNTSGVSQVAKLDIVLIATGGGWFGTQVLIPAGAMVTLTVSGPITTLPTGTHAAEVRVTPTPPATAPGGIHPFTITVTPGGSILVPSTAGPTII